MSGKHVSRVGALRSALAVALVGVRELVVFTTIGVVAPVALLLAVPSLLDDGRAMLDAPVCEEGGSDCLEPRAVERLASTAGPTWRLELADGSHTELTFPRADEPSGVGSLHVLFWNDDQVALLQDDGTVVGSLRWGRLYGVSERPLLLAPLWPVAVLALAVLVLGRSRRRQLVLLGVLAAGAAAAGPTAYAGLLEAGYPGLVAGGLAPVAVALFVAGPVQWVARRRAGRPARKSAAAQPRMPQQRAQVQEPERAEAR